MSVTSLSSSESAVDYVNSKGRLIARSLGLSEKKYDNTFSVRIYNDVIIEKKYFEKLPITFKEKIESKYLNSTVSYHNKIDNTFKIGYFTLDAWRISKMLQGDWDEKMADIFLKTVRNEDINPNEFSRFFSNRRVSYFGAELGGHSNKLLFHNFIQLPLIPLMIRNTKLEAINKDMIKVGDDYCIFESSKVTPEDSLLLYEEDRFKEGLNPDYINPYTRHKISSRFFGEII